MTWHEKIGLMCTTYALKNYFLCLTFCIGYTSSVNCITFLIVCYTSCKVLIDKICLWNFDVQKVFQILCVHKPYFLILGHIYLWKVVLLCRQSLHNHHERCSQACKVLNPLHEVPQPCHNLTSSVFILRTYSRIALLERKNYGKSGNLYLVFKVEFSTILGRNLTTVEQKLQTLTALK